MRSHWRRINRAFGHVNALDDSIRRWLDSDVYRIVKEHDAESRRTAYVARIKDQPPDEWGDIASEAVHMLRSALEHLAFALNEKGYADAHQGAALPAKDRVDSTFPIYGNENQRGEPADGSHMFRSATGYRNMPNGARDIIERLQPYKRGQNFRSDPLWILDSLSRPDKHRLGIELSAAQPSQHVRHLHFEGAVSEAAIGIGGPVYDGKELTHWVIPEGSPEPDPDIYFSRDVAFGEGAAQGQPVIPTLKGVRNYIRFTVAFPLDKFL